MHSALISLVTGLKKPRSTEVLNLCTDISLYVFRLFYNKGKTEQQFIEACDKMTGTYPIFIFKQLLEYKDRIRPRHLITSLDELLLGLPFIVKQPKDV